MSDRREGLFVFIINYILFGYYSNLEFGIFCDDLSSGIHKRTYLKVEKLKSTLSTVFSAFNVQMMMNFDSLKL